MSGLFNSIICIITFAFGVSSLVVVRKGDPCTTPNNETAVCINLLDCETLVKSFQTLTPEKTKFLQESQCGIDADKRPLVCCGYKGDYNKINLASIIFNTLPPEFKANELLPKEDICGKQPIQERIWNGNVTGIDEFPWMALLGYRHKYGGFENFRCGGVLINKRYVLTAAHCVNNWNLYMVHLGEHDTRTKKDCIEIDGILDCNDPPVDYLIEKIIVHPEYFINPYAIRNDIALIRLQEEVKFTSFIVPICLPLNASRTDPGTKVWVAGWGKTNESSESPVKLKVDLSIADKKSCKEAYKLFSEKVEIKEETQICAIGKDNKDSCQGDSGGPLMRSIDTSDEIWYTIGIVSFGPTYCGTDNVPGIYTDIYDYITWILENIEI